MSRHASVAVRSMVLSGRYLGLQSRGHSGRFALATREALLQARNESVRCPVQVLLYIWRERVQHEERILGFGAKRGTRPLAPIPSPAGHSFVVNPYWLSRGDNYGFGSRVR